MRDKNSLSFQTQNGGNAGAFMMSLIATCMAQKINPLDYLTAVTSVATKHQFR
jgi:hypothetical protein